MEVSRFEKAAAKRTAQNTKVYRVKRDKLQAKAEALINEIELLQKQIDAFDAPFIEKYGKNVEDLLKEWDGETTETPAESASQVEDSDFPFNS